MRYNAAFETLLLGHLLTNSKSIKTIGVMEIHQLDVKFNICIPYP